MPFVHVHAPTRGPVQRHQPSVLASYFICACLANRRAGGNAPAAKVSHARPEAREHCTCDALGDGHTFAVQERSIGKRKKGCACITYLCFSSRGLLARCPIATPSTGGCGVAIAKLDSACLRGLEPPRRRWRRKRHAKVSHTHSTIWRQQAHRPTRHKRRGRVTFVN